MLRVNSAIGRLPKVGVPGRSCTCRTIRPMGDGASISVYECVLMSTRAMPARPPAARIAMLHKVSGRSLATERSAHMRRGGSTPHAGRCRKEGSSRRGAPGAFPT
jgi:hypothetical protein